MVWKGSSIKVVLAKTDFLTPPLPAGQHRPFGRYPHPGGPARIAQKRLKRMIFAIRTTLDGEVGVASECETHIWSKSSEIDVLFMGRPPSPLIRSHPLLVEPPHRTGRLWWMAPKCRKPFTFLQTTEYIDKAMWISYRPVMFFVCVCDL